MSIADKLTPAQATVLRALGAGGTLQEVPGNLGQYCLWVPGEGTRSVLYATFRQLRGPGLIEYPATGDAPLSPRTYTLTPAGRAWLAAHPEAPARECACCCEPISDDTALFSPSGRYELCPFCDAHGCAPERGKVACRE